MSTEEFSELYLPLRGALYRVAFFILESEDDAMDAVQDLYLKLLSSPDALETVRNPKAYCITLMRNICLDRVRKASRRPETEVMEAVSDESPADERVSDRQRIKDICKKLSSLPERERTVLRMKVFEDLSYDEIQKRTGIGYLGLRVLLSNARRKLRMSEN